jgi:hypothetical protein
MNMDAGKTSPATQQKYKRASTLRSLTLLLITRTQPWVDRLRIQEGLLVHPLLKKGREIPDEHRYPVAVEACQVNRYCQGKGDLL